MTKQHTFQPVPPSTIRGHDADFGVGRSIARDRLGENFKVKPRKIIPIEEEGADGCNVGLPFSVCGGNGNVEVGGETVPEVLTDGRPIFKGNGGWHMQVFSDETKYMAIGFGKGHN